MRVYRRIHPTWALAITLTLTPSCKVQGPSDNKASSNQTAATPAPGAPPASGFLTANDLAPGPNVTPLAAENMLAELRSKDFLYANKPSSAPSCLTDLLSRVPVTATANGLSVSASIDALACTTQLFNAASATTGVTYTFTASTVRLSALYTCNGGSLASFANQPAGSLTQKISQLSAACPQLSWQIESSWDYADTYTGTVGNGSETVKAVDVYGGENLGLCSATTAAGTITLGAGCVYVSHVLINKSPTNGGTHVTTESYVKLAAQGLIREANPAAIWPSHGQIQIAIGNWTGVANYTAATVPPALAMNAPGQSAVNVPLASAAGFLTTPDSAEELRRAVARQIGQLRP